MKKLAELVVLEVASVLAGPSVGMFFAELGARVVKLEPPQGDVTRTWKLPSEEGTSPVSAYFSSINYGKEYVRINLTTGEGQIALKQLISTCDVIITNNPADQAKKLGLDRDSIRATNPTIIHGHIKGFAEAELPAYDIVLQAETGYIGMTGHDGNLARLPIAMIDVLAGHQLKEGVLAALLNHNETGAYVEVSLEEAALSGLINQASNYLMEGHTAAPLGTQHPNIAPYGDLFTTADGKHVLVACGSDGHFNSLCTTIGQDTLLQDERFRSNQDRLQNRAALVTLLNSSIEQLSSEAFVTRMHAAHIPAAVVRSIDEVLEKPVAKRMILEEEIGGIPTKRIKGNAFRIEVEKES